MPAKAKRDDDMTTTATGESTSALRTIAVFKLLKAIILIVAGLGALGLLNPDWDDIAMASLDDLSLHEGRRFVSRGAAMLVGMLGEATPQRLVLIGIGSFAYACVFLTEATGLWLGKRWAEYLTIVATGSLLPVELIAVAHERSPIRIATLVINIVVVTYLVVAVLRKRRADPPSAATPA